MSIEALAERLPIRVSAQFIATSPRLDPAEITQILQLSPTKARKQGDPMRTTGGNVSRAPRAVEGLWRLSSEELQSSLLDEHMEWLLSRITPRSAEIAAIIQDGVEVTLRILWLANPELSWVCPEISARHMKSLANLNIPLSIDICFRYAESSEDVNLPV